jgi:hypothetical protein
MHVTIFSTRLFDDIKFPIDDSNGPTYRFPAGDGEAAVAFPRLQ